MLPIFAPRQVSVNLYALRLLKRNGVQSSDLRRVFFQFYSAWSWIRVPGMAFFSTEFTQWPNLTYPKRCSENYPTIPGQSYHECLNNLKLPTLTERRESLSACVFYKKICCGTSSKLFELLPKPMDHLHYRLNFDLNTYRQKFHHSLKEHRKISNIPKFRCEML